MIIEYEALQACASMLVSKRCNFHPPYWVTFEKIANSYKIFIKKNSFVSWAQPQFPFLPKLHLKYMKIDSVAFTQSCKDVKYLSFTTLDPCNCLGGSPISISAQVFFNNLQLKKFWAWEETKTGLLWGRIKSQVLDEFPVGWIFHIFTEN